jgi:hypothetical protein
MNQIIQTLKPKEVIAYFNKKFIAPFLQIHGFKFNENTLEYHRKTKDFKQVIWHRCSKNNLTGHIIDFEVGYSILCPRFKSWFKKKYGKDPVGGDSIIGNRRLPSDNTWNGKYNEYIGVFGYDLVNKDIDDQFAVILENLQNVILPHLDYYSDLNTVIENPNPTIQSGEFDLFAHLRQIDHCLFLGNYERAKSKTDALLNQSTMPESYYAYRDSELMRIFGTQ